MDRAVFIDAVLARRNLGSQLRPRIERLLDGVEDRRRLGCCSSGCFVCVEDLKAILVEVEQAQDASAARRRATMG